MRRRVTGQPGVKGREVDITGWEDPQTHTARDEDTGRRTVTMDATFHAHP